MTCSPRTLAALALTLVMLPGSSLAQYPGSKPVPQRMRAGFDSINPEDCRGWLSVLASDAFEGRATGTPGYQKAADFMAKHLASFGVKPLGEDGTFFQGVPFRGVKTRDEESWLRLASGGRTFECGKDLSFTPSDARVDGKVAFLFISGRGAALERKQQKLLRGRILLVQGLGGAGRPLRGQLFAARPAAILSIVEQVTPSSRRASRRSSRRRTPRRVRGEITSAAATELAGAIGIKSRKLNPALRGDAAKVVVGGDDEVVIQVKRETGEMMVPNIVGFLEGSDPKLRHEVVIMGSHLDHIGKRGNQINNGADDDGSGSTAILAVARAFTKNPVRPRRSLLFLAFCGEEMNLIGSRYYADNPIMPLETAVCELQMDMIGRNEEKGNERPEDNVRTTHLVGSKRLSMDLHELVLKANRHVGFTFEYDEEDVYTRSDHYSFARKGVPIAFFFSGFHPDYHRPTDTVDKINFEKLSNTAKLVYLTAFMAADRKERLKVDKKKSERPKRSR